MKLKRYMIGFHILMIGLLFVFLFRLDKMEYTAVDMAELNGKMKQVESEMNELAAESGASTDDVTQISQIEQQYQCEITFLQDSDYMQVLYGAYTNGDTVFDYMIDNELNGKIIFPRVDDRYQVAKKMLLRVVTIVILVVILGVDVLLLVIYFRIFRPFQKLQKFATNISSGNLDAPLAMNQHNYFGAFTESFDVMREELKTAREGEAKANRSKKELVASLSHDIKTPVATIKALCEILEIKLNGNEAVTKIHTIQQKADLIDQLISNLFHATLSELETLKITPIPEPSNILLPMIEEMNHYEKIDICNELPSCLVICDKLRMTQVLDNIIGNSYKYAGTRIHVTFRETETELILRLKDDGKELDDLDFALVCEKFYRGSNVKGQSGSGLGLYLAKQFMEGMKGSLQCEKEHGFAVVLTLKKAGKEEN